MKRCGHVTVFFAVLASTYGCSGNDQKQPGNSVSNVSPSSSNSKKVAVDTPNELGFAKICIWDGDQYQEGIVDAQRNEVLHPQSNVLVNEITGNRALVQVERKFLFVPLDQGPVSADDLASVVGYYNLEVKRIRVGRNERYGFLDEHAKIVIPVKYEYAEIFTHGKAKVMIEGRTFFINPDGNEVPD